MSVTTWDSTRGADGMAPLRAAQEQAIQDRMREVEEAQKAAQRAETVRALVTSPGWAEYMEWLSEIKENVVLQLRSSPDFGDMRASQGKLNVLDLIMDYEKIVQDQADSLAEVARDGARA